MRRIVGSALLAVVLALTGCTTGATSNETGRTLRVYAAASLSPAFDEIADAFEREHPGVEVELVYEGSSTLVTQVAAGAPADVLAVADEAAMARVGDAVARPRVFATNTLVIAVPVGNPAAVRDLADLPGVATVLCAPEVPCGAAARALLSAAEVEVVPVSVEQNVAAVLAKVAAREVDAGLVYATDTTGATTVEAVEPQGAADVVNRYPIAVLQDSDERAAAEEFVHFVTSAPARAVLAARGFGEP